MWNICGHVSLTRGDYCGADPTESGLERGASGLQGTLQELLSGAFAQGDEDIQGEATSVEHIGVTGRDGEG